MSSFTRALHALPMPPLVIEPLNWKRTLLMVLRIEHIHRRSCISAQCLSNTLTEVSDSECLRSTVFTLTLRP